MSEKDGRGDGAGKVALLGVAGVAIWLLMRDRDDKGTGSYVGGNAADLPAITPTPFQLNEPVNQSPIVSGNSGNSYIGGKLNGLEVGQWLALRRQKLYGAEQYLSGDVWANLMNENYAGVFPTGFAGEKYSHPEYLALLRSKGII